MSVPIKMKITKEKLQQIIKEEYQRALSEIDPERHGMGRTYSAYEIPDDFEQDMYPGADERGDPDNWDRPDPYRVDALAAVDQLKELISDVDTDILEYEDILAAVQALRNKLEYYMS